MVKTIVERLKAVRGRCVGCIGRLSKHPMVLKLLLLVAGKILVRIAYFFGSVLLYAIGLPLPF